MTRLARTIVAISCAAVLMVGGQQAASALTPPATTTTATVDSTSITAIVGWTVPPLPGPTGTVAFSVDGKTVGMKQLPAVQPGDSTITVKLEYHVKPGKTRIVKATYSGDSLYGGSHDTIKRRDPGMTKSIKSKAPKTKYGWYRTAVRVVFHCTPRGSRTKCPSPLRFGHSGRDQRGSATTTAANGGSTTVRVKQINIDKHKPTLSVIRSGGKLHCRATDPLSGVASCKIHQKAGTYRAVAKDKAGNRTVVSGRI
ncbi:MAG TPA: Ig-like domain-containing protein [Jatrophihabitantaceae bacterium]|jgi:hypothetical protein|nr:Ig-like domain-containing protein [Jatrophihabitantaceae bacterium]